MKSFSVILLMNTSVAMTILKLYEAVYAFNVWAALVALSAVAIAATLAVTLVHPNRHVWGDARPLAFILLLMEIYAYTLGRVALHPEWNEQRVLGTALAILLVVSLVTYYVLYIHLAANQAKYRDPVNWPTVRGAFPMLMASLKGADNAEIAAPTDQDGDK